MAVDIIYLLFSANTCYPYFVKRFQQPKTPYLPTVAFALGVGAVALGEQSKEDLDRFCNLLNSTEHPELREHLRRLVKAWQASGPNLIKMTDPIPSEAYEGLESLFTTAWIPTRSGRASLWVMADEKQLERLIGGKPFTGEIRDGMPTLIPEAEAWVQFGFFTLNPFCEELAGPCARCGNYFVKKRASQKIYCSRRCGNAATAVARTRERIASERRDKLARAKSAMKKWESATTRKDWKDWVTQKTGIDPRFLTRAVTKGDLVPPKRGK